MRLPQPLLPVLVILAAAPASPAWAAASALPTYATEPALRPLTFQAPVTVLAPPGETTRLFVVEKPGRIVGVSNLGGTPERSVFLDITDRVGDGNGERGLLALAFHPDYATNRHFFVWYTSTQGSRSEDRLARFTASATDPGRADAGSEQILISQPDDAQNHNGGQLVFGPDGYLYVSLGDEGRANDVLQNSQRIDKDFFAGVLRIDVDLKPDNLEPNPHPASRPGTYRIPRDNPYVGLANFAGERVDPERLRTEFWAIGLRNPWRMNFDPETGLLWAGDVGQNQYEEIDVIVRGGNYGWNFREARIAGPRSNPPASLSFIDPVWDYPRSEGSSISGGFVYRGDRYPELNGHYLFADYGSGRVWALQPNGTERVPPEAVHEIAHISSVASFGLDPSNGDILVATQSGNQLLRLVPAQAAP